MIESLKTTVDKLQAQVVGLEEKLSSHESVDRTGLEDGELKDGTLVGEDDE